MPSSGWKWNTFSEVVSFWGTKKSHRTKRGKNLFSDVKQKALQNVWVVRNNHKVKFTCPVKYLVLLSLKQCFKHSETFKIECLVDCSEGRNPFGVTGSNPLQQWCWQCSANSYHNKVAQKSRKRSSHCCNFMNYEHSIMSTLMMEAETVSEALKFDVKFDTSDRPRRIHCIQSRWKLQTVHK
jgi:hypothetical protein